MYAKHTTVAPERSRAEIEAVLKRYGATAYSYGTTENSAFVAFKASARLVRFIIPLPKPEEMTVRRKSYRASMDSQREAAATQEERRRWRCLALTIKSKLETVRSQISSFEEEFMPYIVLPDGSTVGQRVLPEIQQAYVSGVSPQKLLPDFIRGEQI